MIPLVTASLELKAYSTSAAQAFPSVTVYSQEVKLVMILKSLWSPSMVLRVFKDSISAIASLT
jgi:hypothetical protein